jgi:hypothetical protein
MNEHKFLADFQPFADASGGKINIVGVGLNWAALFGVFYVIGAALKLGLGL